MSDDSVKIKEEIETEKKFDIIFTGNITGSADIASVKTKAVQLFRLDDKKLATLFSGKRTTLKKNVDKNAAQKYQKVLKGIGMITVLQIHGAVQIKPSSVTARPVDMGSSVANEVTPSLVRSTTSKASNPHWDVLPVGDFRGGGEISESDISDVSASSLSFSPVGDSESRKVSDWTIEQPGVQLSEPSEDAHSDIVLPNITVAPPASDLLNNDEKQGMLAPLELSALADISVTSVGDDLLSEEEKVEWTELPMELSHLNVAAGGRDLLADHEKTTFVEKVINTDNIHLENN